MSEDQTTPATPDQTPATVRLSEAPAAAAEATLPTNVLTVQNQRVDVDALKRQHGDVYLLGDEPELQVIVRAPTQAEYRQFMASEPGKRSEATENLAYACTLVPAGMGDLGRRYPALPFVVTEELLKLAGARAALTVKKL